MHTAAKRHVKVASVLLDRGAKIEAENKVCHRIRIVVSKLLYDIRFNCHYRMVSIIDLCVDKIFIVG